MLLVLFQHQLAVLGMDCFTSFWGLNIGQMGVSIFLAISGILAIQTHRKPLAWLHARLLGIYPAFWIATLFGFVVAAASGYKRFTIVQFLSQLAGTGLFTHGMDLINVATWFVSLLLVLYLIVFAAKSFPFTEISLFLIALVCLGGSAYGAQPLLLVHAATFLLAAVSLGSKQIGKYWLLLSFGIITPFAFKSIYAAYPAISLGLCLLAFQLPSASAGIRFLSRYSYEFYLLHGIFLVGSHQIFSGAPWIGVPLGIISSLGGAVLLHHSVRKLRENLPESICARAIRE
jgi:peptidoglycan/LPS O-acetylase OafA/YrhL